MTPTAEWPSTDVLITDELARRTPKRTDYLEEKLALQDLAARMAHSPEAILPRFVQLAMQITEGSSAGLSLYEPEPAPGVFRWRHLCGVLAAFEGATTPRNYSPCGVTLDQRAPVLTRHAERYYDWIAAANIIVPEVLLVPLYVGGHDPAGTLWVVGEDEGHFDAGHARATSELASFVGVALRVQRTEQQLREALAHQETLAREMSHRVKNLFALTDSMIRFSVRSSGGKREMAQMLTARLQALASAHGLLLGDAPGGRSEAVSFNLRDLLLAVVQPHQHAGYASPARVVVSGPDFTCASHAANGFALVVHELTTNAIKYGALKTARGKVELTWQVTEDNLVLQWSESGGPPVTAPCAMGFGQTLTENIIVRQFHGRVEYDWRRGGLAMRIAIPITSVVAKPLSAQAIEATD